MGKRMLVKVAFSRRLFHTGDARTHIPVGIPCFFIFQVTLLSFIILLKYISAFLVVPKCMSGK